jgi:hypothetical protein
MSQQIISNYIRSIIKSARTGDYGQTSSDLNQWLIVLQSELSKGSVSPQSLSKICYSLETMVEMQKMGNWVAVADVLEYELLTLCENLQ